MRFARRALTPAGWRLRRVSLGLGCLLLALLDVGDCETDESTTSASPPVTGAPTATPASPSTAPQQQQQQQDADTVTCYTCVNVSDNLICNRFAIDRPCPVGEPFCHTLHIMDSRGHSVVVHKKCASPAECTPRTVGCLDIDSQRVCVSCCDEMYCNEPVPTNHSNAVYSASRQEQLLLLQQHHHSTAAPVTSAHAPISIPGPREIFLWTVLWAVAICT